MANGLSGYLFIWSTFSPLEPQVITNSGVQNVENENVHCENTKQDLGVSKIAELSSNLVSSRNHAR